MQDQERKRNQQRKVSSCIPTDTPEENRTENKTKEKLYGKRKLALDKRVKELKRELEGWREVILPLNSVLLWEKNFYPGLLAGVTTAFFLLFWLLDPSLLTTVSVIGLVAALVDYLVPTLTASLCHPESWTGAKERKLEDICRALVITEHQGISYCKTFYEMRNTRPKMYYLSVIVSLVFLAWLGNTVNNLLLTYLFVLVLLLLPGLKHHGILKKYVSQLMLLFTETVKGIKEKKN
uniref:RETREG1-3/ARL6IP-like N-terminal reticulon-homology domain-containing protein n=1 Tax=Timema genevievae TaxID=629358 RepID=A0A7R9K5A1_TIMGE|nr:unnamed protein product [Timema genevievae]